LCALGGLFAGRIGERPDGTPVGWRDTHLCQRRKGALAMTLVATAWSTPPSLKQDVEIDGRHRLTTDEPEAVGGDGSAPSPHELLPAALASCISTQLVMYARTKAGSLAMCRYTSSTTIAAKRSARHDHQPRARRGAFSEPSCAEDPGGPAGSRPRSRRPGDEAPRAPTAERSRPRTRSRRRALR
jgi:hypothetical protein